MSVYRYTRRAAVGAGDAEASQAVEVTLTNPEFKAELDRTMDRMGFEFAGGRDELSNAVAPGFPVSRGTAGAEEPFGADFLDRPTPVQRAAQPLPPFGAAGFGANGGSGVAQTLD